MAVNKHYRVYRYLRYALYAFFVFSTTQYYYASAIPVNFSVCLLLVIVAEKLFTKKFYVLFSLIIINRIFNASINFTDFFYTIFDPNATYYFMIEVYDFNHIFYLVATHICFVFLAIKRKEPNIVYPIVISTMIYFFTLQIPDMKNAVFYLLYGFGIFSFTYIMYVVYKSYNFYNHRRVGLMVIYFVYSTLLLIKHLNQNGDYLKDFNFSYAYPLVMFLAMLLVIGREKVIQFLLNKIFVIAIISISIILAFIQREYITGVMHHFVFVASILLINKIIIDVRGTVRAYYY